ncbi:helix-turn-helix transcriptional regulator [Micromonospora sp. DPT]|uniref:helix-turn-helix domain-containing protein n=1 Tax=Micromonospora sp. DPT TaxID=3142975 RepID=UPI00320B79C9
MTVVAEPNDPGKVAARLDPDSLYVAIDRQRRKRRMQWREAAREAGVSPSTLTRIGQGKRPDADGLVRLLAWLGTTDLAPFITRSQP